MRASSASAPRASPAFRRERASATRRLSATAPVLAAGALGSRSGSTPRDAALGGDASGAGAPSPFARGAAGAGRDDAGGSGASASNGASGGAMGSAAAGAALATTSAGASAAPSSAPESASQPALVTPPSSTPTSADLIAAVPAVAFSVEAPTATAIDARRASLAP